MMAADHADDKPVRVTNKVFTLANMFSVSRIVVSVPLIWIYQYYGGITWIFTALIFYGIISDYLDGWAARKHDEISELGKVIDPIADKIMAGILFIFAVYLGKIPLWFLVVSLSRDALILAGSIYLRVSRGKVAMSVMSGKVFVNALAMYWIAAMYFPENVSVVQFFLTGTTVLMVYSFGDYLYRFVRILRGASYN